jgi:hypothetical protein
MRELLLCASTECIPPASCKATGRADSNQKLLCVIGRESRELKTRTKAQGGLSPEAQLGFRVGGGVAAPAMSAGELSSARAPPGAPREILHCSHEVPVNPCATRLGGAGRLPRESTRGGSASARRVMLMYSADGDSPLLHTRRVDDRAGTNDPPEDACLRATRLWGERECLEHATCRSCVRFATT